MVGQIICSAILLKLDCARQQKFDVLWTVLSLFIHRLIGRMTEEDLIIIIIIIIIIIQQFIRCRNMSKSLQGHRITSNANMWVANSYYILYDKENRCVLSRFLNVDGVGAVRMSRGKLFDGECRVVKLPGLSRRLVRGTRRSPRAAEWRAEHVATVVTGTHISLICVGAGPFIAL